MKRILINMNRSGYFWHELDNTALLSNNPVVKMKREISEDSHPSISAMRTYEQFNYLFMKGSGDYILSIRNLNDPRTDGAGRSLKQHVIFEDEDKELLLKILAYYLTQPEEFEKWITNECFKPGQNDALCKTKPFLEKIEQIKKSTLNPIMQDCEFAISSHQSAEWLQEKLLIKGVNVSEFQNKLDDMKGTKFLTLYMESNGVVTEHSTMPTNSLDDERINQLQKDNRQLQEENQLLQKNCQLMQVKLITEQDNLRKWKLYAKILAVIAGVSILFYIVSALKN